MSKENETLENLIEGNDFIADVSNCAFGKILNEFRQWQREWDLYDSRQTLKKPQSSDGFIKGLKSKYVIGFKHCC
jgi:hypothetical protein